MTVIVASKASDIGGWVVGNDVLSVNSYGYSNQPNVMYGPYQGSVAQQLYTSAAGS